MSPRIHNLGLPRIGEKRELKFALEKYWKGDMSEKALLETADALQDRLWEVQIQQGQDFLTVGDFSLYDHVLDASFLLGHLPDRFQNLPRQGSALEAYFAAARGITLAQDGQEKRNLPAQALTKWFDTNYHYLVPELEPQTHFSLQKDRLSRTIQRAKGHGHPLKYKVLGPLTYLYLCQDKRKPASLESIMKRKSSELRLVPKLDYLPELLRVFQELFAFLTDQGITWIQVDEPFLVYDDMSQDWIRSFTGAYEILGPQFPLILTSYFDHLGDNLPTFLAAPVSGFHLDYPAHRNELHQIQADLNPQQILSLGVVSGRNVWSSNLLEISEGLEDLSQKLGERLWLAPSADLLHLPWSLSIESLPAALEGRLAFAVERLTELRRLKAQLNGEQPWTPEEKEKYHRIQKAGDAVIKERRQKIADLEEGEFHRVPPQERQRLQQARWGLPNFPTTTIGSFPQTPTIRKLRRLHNTGELTEKSYRLNIQQIIKENIQIQEEIGLDVLVHGEPERSDMVSFFADALEGYWQSQGGWVQSYGSRCVRPPIIHGLISRKTDLGKDWTVYAQSLTKRPVKGMLTGPVTLFKWAFPPQEESPADVVMDLALALRQEVLELEAQGIGIIQIDEPAYREVLPLKTKEWSRALNWASRAFRLSHLGVKSETQVHTHMCYSDFVSIFDGIEAMDADVISIETSRGQQRLLQGLEKEGYSKGLGPGVYDIHSPLIPEQKAMVDLLRSVSAQIPAERLWVNPDCGLKTRKWEEVIPSLKAMVGAAQELRKC